MAISLFAGLTKYGESWNMKSQFELSSEDKSMLEAKCKCVESTYGRSMCFFAKGNSYKQYIPLNDRSSAQLNTYYPVSELLIQELEKDGKTIYRCLLKSDNL